MVSVVLWLLMNIVCELVARTETEDTVDQPSLHMSWMFHQLCESYVPQGLVYFMSILRDVADVEISDNECSILRIKQLKQILQKVAVWCTSRSVHVNDIQEARLDFGHLVVWHGDIIFEFKVLLIKGGDTFTLANTIVVLSP